MNKKIVAISGGPGSGKTTLLEGLNSKGYIYYPEISREVTLEAKKQGTDQLFLEKPLLFSELLLKGRIKQFIDAKNEDSNTVFIDRGIPDILAYMNFIRMPFPDFFDEACKNYTYSKIFFLPPWKEIYTTDNARYENYKQAEAISFHIKETYKKYGYNLIEVPKDTVNNRIHYILEHLSI